jgi:hypothetical protein
VKRFFVLLLLAGCGRSCFGEATTETFHGKVKLEVTKETHMQNGTLFTSDLLHVETPTPFKIGIACPDPLLGEDDTGTLVAWKCKTAPMWSLSRIVGSHHHEECEVSELGTTGKPDFSKVRTLEAAAVHITQCARKIEGWGEDQKKQVLAWLAEDIRGRGGAADQAKFLTSVAEWEPGNTDPWMTVVTGLVPGDRAELEKALCPSLGNEHSDPVVYVHAARLCPYDTAASDAAVRLLRAVPATGFVEKNAYWAGLVAASTSAKDAGDTGCTGSSKGNPQLRAVWATLVAITKTRCPVTVECADLALCGPTICSEKDSRAALDVWMGIAKLAKPTDARATSIEPPADHALTAAAFVQGPLPKEASARRLRTTYTIQSGAGPECVTTTLAAGTPCICGEMPKATVACDVPSTSNTVDFTCCKFHIDDRARTIGSPTRTCIATPGTECKSSFICCAPLTCQLHGSRQECR